MGSCADGFKEGYEQAYNGETTEDPTTSAAMATFDDSVAEATGESVLEIFLSSPHPVFLGDIESARQFAERHQFRVGNGNWGEEGLAPIGSVDGKSLDGSFFGDAIIWEMSLGFDTAGGLLTEEQACRLAREYIDMDTFGFYDSYSFYDAKYERTGYVLEFRERDTYTGEQLLSDKAFVVFSRYQSTPGGIKSARFETEIPSYMTDLDRLPWDAWSKLY